MSSRVRKGFCKDCCANINHTRIFRSKIGWFLDFITFRFVSRFRLGPWRCPQCNRRSFYLHLPRGSANTIRPSTRLRSVAEEEKVVVEHAGNYLRREKSLVARRERCSRYSEKYRESIVQKILDGDSTIAEVRRELDLSEQDILDWIALAYFDQAKKIEELNAIIFALTEGAPMRIEASDPMDGPVVSGSKSSSKRN